MLTRYRGLLPGPGTGTYIHSKDRFGKEAILFKILIVLLYSQFLFDFDILIHLESSLPDITSQLREKAELWSSTTGGKHQTSAF